MCGITGLVDKNGYYEANHFDGLLRLLTHRGPDDRGTWTSACGRIRLGHTRLSILDLSMAAHQPMVSLCGKYIIVFNGEIYNFRELRSELEQSGLKFTGTGDTEVALAAYIKWGAACLKRFNGMFAFAVYQQSIGDKPASLFLARDRAGEKPLYYSNVNGVFRFASEIKALHIGGELDLFALNFYLALGYVPHHLCLFKGASKLPPAHFALVNMDTGELAIECYWTLPENRPVTNVDGPELAEEAGELIEDSVRLRLVADVPVGILLSGGLDSSLIVAAAAQVSSHPIKTFTMTLPGSSLDEAHHAKQVSNYFGTQHHVLAMNHLSLNLLDGFAPFVDEPIADSSILPAWLVFGLARNEVTVGLGGDGGDELFGGYSDYTTSLMDAQRWNWVPPPLMCTIAKAAAFLPAGMRGRNRLASLRKGPMQQLIFGGAYFDSKLRSRLLKPGVVSELGAGIEAPEYFLLQLFNQGTDDLDRMTRTHFGSILPDDFLVKVDRTSMAHSLELRTPFLDHRLIEFAFGKVPSEWKVSMGESRRLQRILAKKWLPPDFCINRKQGFSIPINEWLRTEGEKGLMARMEGLPDVILMDNVRKLVRGHMLGRANGGRLFALIMLSIAMRNLNS